jgi:hypothetical protein
MGIILVVSIRIDDDIRTLGQRLLDSGHESRCQTSIFFGSDDMVNRESIGYIRGTVGAAIVNDQPLNRIKTLYFPGQGSQRHG